LRLSNLTNGVLTYHLALLEKSELIEVDRDENKKMTRYYPNNIPIQETYIIGCIRQDATKQIILFILENDLCIFDEIVEHAKKALSTISWHLKRLKEAGIISVQHGNNNSPPTDSRKPFWETIFVSATHCGAGCALGDVVSEWSIFLSGVTIAGVALWPSYIFDFILAWVLGIIFQYLAIVQMRKISLREGLVEAIKADTLSFVTFEIGLFGWMSSL
jgi:hypothetical protein